MTSRLRGWSLLVALCATPAAAQTVTSDPPTTVVSWSATVANGITSNVEFDDRDENAAGAIVGAGVRLERGRLLLGYDVARHAYTAETSLTRVSQQFSVLYGRPLPGRWRAELGGDLALNGTLDGRSPVDRVYALSPQFTYRRRSRHRLRFLTIHQLRQSNDEPADAAVRHYAAVEYRHAAGGRRHWEIGGRVDAHDRLHRRGDYRRLALWVERRFALTGRDDLRLAAEYRRRQYLDRFVESEVGEVPRSERRLTTGVRWSRSLTDQMDWRIDYEFEVNRSNDLDRDYDAHLLWSRVVIGW